MLKDTLPSRDATRALLTTLALATGALLAPTSASAQTLVAPTAATSTNEIATSYGALQTINGGGLNGTDLSATHERAASSGYENKFWISQAGVGHPQTLSYVFASETLSGVAIWNTAFVLPLQSHYEYDGTITAFDLEIDHSGGTAIATGLTLTEDNINAQTFDFCGTLTGVTQVRFLTRADNRPVGGGDKNLYMSEFRGVANGPATNCIFGTSITAPADGATLNDGTPTIAGTFIAGGTVDLEILDSSGNVVETATVVADGSGQWSYTSSGIGDETYTVRATVNDPSIGQMTAEIDFTLDLCGNAVLDVGEQCDGAVEGCDASCNVLPGYDCSCASPAFATSGAATPAGIIGGAGGSVVPRQDCPDGEVLIGVGFEMSDSNGTVTRSRLFCGALSLDAQGAVNTTQTSTLTTAGAGCAGWDPATATPDALCPSGSVLTAMSAERVGSTTFSDISITCTPVDTDGTLLDAQAQTTLVTGTDSGAGSTTTTATCPAGEVMMGFASRTGCGQDSIEPFCAPFAKDCQEQASVCEDVTPPTLTLSTPADNDLYATSIIRASGTSEADATIEVTVTDASGTATILTATADAQGDWFVDTAALADGTYSFSVTATDASGNTSAPVTANSVEVDTTPPALAVTSPADGEVTNDPTVSIGGTSEANAAISITVTDASGTATPLSTTANAQGDWTVDTSALADGTYTLSVEASDALGNTTTPVTSTFTVDTMAPALAVTSPADGALTNNNVVSISGTCEAGAAISITVTDASGAVTVLTTTADAQGDWTVDTSALGDDTYTVSVTATDGANNTSAPSTSTFTVDTTAPVIAISTPTTGQILTEMVSTTGTTEAGANVTLSLQDATGAEVATATATADAAGAWSGMFTASMSGDYTIVATTADAAGNSASDQVTFTVDLRTPMLDLESPADDLETSEVRPVFSGSVDLDATVEVVIFDDQGNEVARYAGMTDANGTFTITPDADLADGTYTAEVTATSANGKTSTSTVTFTVDTLAPTLTIATPADGLVTSMAEVLVTGATEPEIFVGAIIYDAQDNEYFNSNIESDTQGNWSIDAGTLADGTYTVIATAADNAGNEVMAGPNTFTIDSTAPMVSIDSPTMGERVLTLRPTISGTADAGLEVAITLDGQALGTTTAANDGTWSIDPTEELAEGEHTVSASVTDASGNTGTSGDVTFNIDLVDPLVITSPENGATIPATGDVTVTGTGEPGTEITVTIGDQTVTTTVDDEGNWSVAINPSGATEGTITVTDGEETLTITVTLDPGMVENANPGNQDPGNMNPGNQDPGTNQDPGNQDPGNMDPGMMEPELGGGTSGTDEGCACSTQSAPGSPGLLLLALGFVGLLRRRRR